MKKTMSMMTAVIAAVMLTSCSSLKNLVNPDYSVHYDLSETEVKAVAAKVESEKNYIKKFMAKDSMGKFHEVIII